MILLGEVSRSVRIARNRLRNAYASHQGVILFAAATALLAAGLHAEKFSAELALVIGVTEFVFVLCYYWAYARHFASVELTFARETRWHNGAFSPWGVLAFNSLALLVFAFACRLLDRFVESTAFGAAQWEQLVLLMLYNVVDGASLGFLSAFDVRFTPVHAISPLGQALGYLCNVLINLSFLGSIIGVFNDALEIRRFRVSIAKDGLVPKSFLANPTRTRIAAIVELTRQGKVDLRRHAVDLLDVLLPLHGKEIRDLALLILQSDCSEPVSERCGEYLRAEGDRRLRRLEKSRRATRPR